MDANIIFAVLIKDGATAHLFTHPTLELYAPDYILSEFWKYLPLMVEKTHRTPAEMLATLRFLQHRITLVAAHDIPEGARAASLQSPDPADAPYLAVAIALGVPLWTNDGRLRMQTPVRVITTAGLLAVLGDQVGKRYK